jgi:hypothetical protein
MASSFSMKFIIIASAMIWAVQIAIAQEPPLPSATATAAPNPSARPELNIPDIPLEVEPSPLVPNTTVPKKSVPSIQEMDTAFQHSSLGAAVEEQRLHLEWRKLQNRASQDAEVISAKKAINTARTDPEKRDLARTYYKVFYAHMLSTAETPDVKAYLEQKKNEALGGLAQPHVRPEPAPRSSAKR